jgi:amidase
VLASPCLSLLGLREAIANGQRSAEEVVEEHLARIARWNPEWNAFTQVFAEEARLAARQPRPGPLSGVPVSIKDSLDVAGFATVCGSPSRLRHRAGRDALCVERLRAAGAIVLGKTNTPEWLMNWDTFNEVYGRTRNPWDLRRSAGGSSGGEGAAIAGGLSAGGIGSDGGGSIRVPAAYNGICGLKPTPGRVPATGHFPQIGHPGGLLGVIGPMARSVADLEVLFEVVAGHDDSDPFSVPVAIQPIPAELRIGVLPHPEIEPYLRFLPGEVDEFPAQPWARLFEVWRFFFLRLNAHAIGFATPHTAEYFAQPAPEGWEILAMLAARDALRGRFLAAMDRFPLLVTACPGEGAFLPDEFPALELMTPLTVANLLGLPALAIPTGLGPDGLPRAIQLIAKPWHEELLVWAGKQFEAARGVFPAPPLVGTR